MEHTHIIAELDTGVLQVVHSHSYMAVGENHKHFASGSLTFGGNQVRFMAQRNTPDDVYRGVNPVDLLLQHPELVEVEDTGKPIDAVAGAIHGHEFSGYIALHKHIQGELAHGHRHNDMDDDSYLHNFV